MKRFQLFLLLSLTTLGAWAQPAPGRDAVAAQIAPEQRRAELRSALKARRSSQAAGKQRAAENAPASRHLSQQERADLRQQLRQQRRDVNERGKRK